MTIKKKKLFIFLSAATFMMIFSSCSPTPFGYNYAPDNDERKNISIEYFKDNSALQENSFSKEKDFLKNLRGRERMVKFQAAGFEIFNPPKAKYSVDYFLDYKKIKTLETFIGNQDSFEFYFPLSYDIGFDISEQNSLKYNKETHFIKYSQEFDGKFLNIKFILAEKKENKTYITIYNHPYILPSGHYVYHAAGHEGKILWADYMNVWAGQTRTIEYDHEMPKEIEGNWCAFPFAFIKGSIYFKQTNKNTWFGEPLIK